MSWEDGKELSNDWKIQRKRKEEKFSLDWPVLSAAARNNKHNNKSILYDIKENQIQKLATVVMDE